MLIRTLKSHIKSNKQLIPPSVIILLSILILVFAPSFENIYDNLIPPDSYLAWHNMFELTATISLIAIFLLNYHIFSQTHRLKTLVIGCVLITAGILEIFHMLTYKGMPPFFGENTSSNRATTFWILSRFVFAIGFLLAGSIHPSIKTKMWRGWFLLCSLTIAFTVFYIVTWHPTLFPPMFVEGQGLTPLKKWLEYLIMVILLADSVVFFRLGRQFRDKMLLILSGALFVNMLGETAFTLYVNVYGVYNFAGHLLVITSMFLAVRNAISRDVLEPFKALTEAQHTLSEHVKNQEMTIEQRTRQLKSTNAKLLEDLEYARGIQKSMLPSFLPDTDEISFSAVYRPTERISGDFYDIFPYDENHIGFYISDVSGHGVPAAMLTVFLKQYIDNVVEADRHKEAFSTPAEVLHQVFDAFNNSHFKDDVYIVLLFCIYDKTNGKLTCSSAGINVPPLLADNMGNIEEISLTGFPICKLSGVMEVEFHDYEFLMKQGDRLYLYTDGLSEARDGKGEYYTGERLKKLLAGSYGMKLFEQASLITDDLLDFVAEKKLEDDVTMLAVEFRK